MNQAIPPFASARRYAFSRGLVPGIDAFCTQAIADASLVGEIPITLKTSIGHQHGSRQFFCLEKKRPGRLILPRFQLLTTSWRSPSV
jgi:hypothetical protein